MYLTGHILTLANSGAPDYNICGQATTILDFVNTTFKLNISKGGSVATTLINTNDLSTLNLGTLPYGVINYGDYDINFISFARNNTTNSYRVELQVYVAGTTNVVTWEKFNISIEIQKSGYQSYLNSFELYNYDIGNDATLGYVNNTDFDIILTNNTNNLDVYGNQTKTGSKLITLRRPFTNEVHFYSMIATQGNIEYYDTITGLILLGTGKSGTIVSEETIDITQTIELTNTESCSDADVANKVIWFPIFSVKYISDPTCGDCTNTLAETTVSYTSDASTTGVFKINNTNYFLHQFMSEKVLIETFDYLGNSIDDNTTTINLTYAAWTSNPATFLTPVDYVITPSTIGDNVIKVTHTYNAIAANSSIIQVLHKCLNEYLLSTCNWWTVTENEECNSYTVNNCSADVISVELQKLNDDKTYTIISTTAVDPFENLVLEFALDGIYMLKVQKDGDPDTEYYSLPVYCALKDCFLKYLQTVLCNKPSSENCNEKDYYTFNAFLINAHTYFLLLNQEFNYNYIYSTISAEKTAELYTLKTFIDRFAEYCQSSNSPCIPCNQ